jgi:hypothetical protein
LPKLVNIPMPAGPAGSAGPAGPAAASAAAAGTVRFIHEGIGGREGSLRGEDRGSSYVSQFVNALLNKYEQFKASLPFNYLPTVEQLNAEVEEIEKRKDKFWPIFVSNLATNVKDPLQQMRIFSLLKYTDTLSIAQAVVHAADDLPAFLDAMFSDLSIGG